MTSDQLARVERAFFQVEQAPRARRDEALRAACGDDADLRREVESLLAHEEPAAGFLEDPALGAGFALSHDAPDDLIGRQVGLYRIERRVASGGMGTVYQAVRADGQFDQRVAVKIVKRGMDSEEIVRRFNLERRTLAGLNHPHIARLLDGATIPDGRPYLVMEFVDGAPIDRYCDARRFSTEQRLRLFLTVCDAVRYAHQNLVVHRDLKPGNILVHADGVPKLVDFGIAKVLAGAGSDEITLPHERRLTPEYASPEQVVGRSLTTASDIYSLGVILYELLSGHRPYRFGTRTAAEIERVICHQAPPAPSQVVTQIETHVLTGGLPAETVTPEFVGQARNESPERLRRRLRGDLDTIALKAMHKDPSRRYASVDQLATDIERYLSGLPVMAQPDRLGYRLRKFVGRHAMGVSTVVGIAALLAIGVGLLGWQSRIARRQRDAAYLARDQAEATVDFFQRMLASADPANAGPDASVRSVLDAAAAEIENDLRNQPLLQAAIRSSIGRAYLALGMLEEAHGHIEPAYAVRVSMLPVGHHDLAESQFDVAKLLYARGEFPRAEALLRESLETHRRLRGEENVDTARVWNDLGAVLRAQGKLNEAETALRIAIRIREKSAGAASLDMAESLNNLAGVLRARGDLDGAADYMDRSLAMRQQLLREDHPLLIQSKANMAVMVASRGNPKRAESLFREVVELDRKVYGEDHPAYATDLSGLSQVLMLQARYAEAEPLLTEALRIRRLRLDEGDRRLLMSQALLGRCMLALGRIDEAESLLADALSRALPGIRTGDASWLAVVDDLQRLYLQTGRPHEAAEMRTIRASMEAPP